MASKKRTRKTADAAKRSIRKRARTTTGTASPDVPWTAREIASMRRALLAHYDRHKRELPWRGETDPYRVWVSEVMLQQTRVETVRERYHAFLASFGTLRALASASEDRVLKAWEGLGYYGRARNLRRAAIAIESFHGGEVPGTSSALAALPGFGAYTSAAVASIAFGEPVAVVDGNVARVVARLLEEDRDADRAAVRTRVATTAQALLDPSRPGDWNQAVMDLGATVCVPREPRCLVCPLAPHCRARASGRQDRIPRRRRRAPVPHHVISAGLVWREGQVLVGRRPSEGLLGGLFEFPGGKVEPGETIPEACRREVSEETGLDVEVVELFRTVEHAYTHFRITMHVFHCRVRGGRLVGKGTEDLRFVPPEELSALAFPRANRRVLDDLDAAGVPSWARS